MGIFHVELGVFDLHSPPFVQQVGHHAHEGLGLDLATLLQFVQVQSEFKSLGSTHNAKVPNYHQCFIVNDDSMKIEMNREYSTLNVVPNSPNSNSNLSFS